MAVNEEAVSLLCLHCRLVPSITLEFLLCLHGGVTDRCVWCREWCDRQTGMSGVEGGVTDRQVCLV